MSPEVELFLWLTAGGTTERVKLTKGPAGRLRRWGKPRSAGGLWTLSVTGVDWGPMSGTHTEPNEPGSVCCTSAPHETPGQWTPRVRPRETLGRECCWSTLHPHFRPVETEMIKGCYFKLLSLWRVKIAIKTKVHFKAAIKMF